MSELAFSCTSVRSEPYAASPTLLFALRLEEPSGARVHAVALRCQIRIEPVRRGYSPEEQEMLTDLFGEPARWGSTLKPLQFAHASTVVPSFTGACETDLPVPCTYDTEVSSASYVRALRGGEVPLLLLFSGTVFAGEGFRPAPIPWNAEARVGLPVAVWREMIDGFFPGTGWLRMRTDALDALRRYRSARALPSWEQTVEELLRAADADALRQAAAPAEGERS